MPAAQLQFRVGDPFVVELWAQTTSPSGLGQVSADVTFDPAVVSTTGINHTAAFNLFTNGSIDNGLGLLDDVSGSHPPTSPPCIDAIGFVPNWARVTLFVMSADAIGQTVLQSADTANPLWIVTNCAGPIPPATFGGVTIDVLASAVSIELIGVPTPGSGDLAAGLPASSAEFVQGTPFFVEMWAQTDAPAGLSQVSADVTFDPAVVSGVGITHTTAFSLFPGGVVDNPGGLLNDVSGLHPIVSPPCSDAIGFAPQWARVAIVEMSADALGPFTMQAGVTGSPVFAVSTCGGALMPIVTYGSLSATIVFADCNNNGVNDASDIAAGTSPDCNANGIPDECDVLPGPLAFARPVAQSLVLGSEPTSVVTGDLNGDGSVDLAVGTNVVGLSNLSVFFNNGDGTFGAVVETNNPNSTNDLKAVDMDADGDLDLVLATNRMGGNDSVLVYRNQGSGFFTNPQLFPTAGTRPLSVDVGDLDGDGDPDVVTANRDSDNVTVLLNNGTGSLGVATTFPVGLRPLWVEVGDWDGDGDLDLVVANTPADVISILVNDGTGTFSGQGPFGAPATISIVGRSPQSVEAADLDRDGDLDLAVVAGGDSVVEVFLNDGAGNFTLNSSIPVGDATLRLTVTDIDGDLDLDLVVLNNVGPGGPLSPPSLSVIANNGDGTFAPAIDVPIGTAPLDLATGDFDGDGQPDVVVADADPVFASAATTPNLTEPPFSGDVDRDGVPDDCAVCGNGIREGAEQCDDGNLVAGDCCSPSCQFESIATVCRAAASACDVAEFCDGAGACPANVFQSAGTACGNPTATVCDNPDTCDGAGACQSNFEPGTTVCRVSAG
ncbi:MAG: FG-GAP-like repeat-containing protein, partial [Phycisphaerae bacterium]